MKENRFFTNTQTGGFNQLKIYCRDCKNFSGDIRNPFCDIPTTYCNTKWFNGQQETTIDNDPKELNKNNDCSYFKRKGG